MRSKRYSNHPTITVLLQGVYASVFVQGTKAISSVQFIPHHGRVSFVLRFGRGPRRLCV
jgi:hypothetical protein